MSLFTIISAVFALLVLDVEVHFHDIIRLVLISYTFFKLHYFNFIVPDLILLLMKFRNGADIHNM